MTESEVPLLGGNMESVVRVGNTVHRESGPWTPAVHALLGAYAEAGIADVPRALGVDERGREVLSFLPGTVLTELDAALQWSPHVLRAAAALLRRLHDASVPLVGNEWVWRGESRHPSEIISHGDFAPYNLLLGDDGEVRVIDCDFAAPGPRIWDLAYLAYRMAPHVADATGYDPARDGARSDRVAWLIEAYGMPFGPDEVRAAMIERLESLAAFTDRRAADTGRADFLAHAAMYRADADALRA